MGNVRLGPGQLSTRDISGVDRRKVEGVGVEHELFAR